MPVSSLAGKTLKYFFKPAMLASQTWGCALIENTLFNNIFKLMCGLNLHAFFALIKLTHFLSNLWYVSVVNSPLHTCNWRTDQHLSLPHTWDWVASIFLIHPRNQANPQCTRTRGWGGGGVDLRNYCIIQECRTGEHRSHLSILKLSNQSLIHPGNLVNSQCTHVYAGKCPASNYSYPMCYRSFGNVASVLHFLCWFCVSLGLCLHDIQFGPN